MKIFIETLPVNSYIPPVGCLEFSYDFAFNWDEYGCVISQGN